MVMHPWSLYTVTIEKELDSTYSDDLKERIKNLLMEGNGLY